VAAFSVALSWLIVAALAAQDRAGSRTLSGFAFLVALLRALGRVVDVIAKLVPAETLPQLLRSAVSPPLPQIAGAALILAAVLSPPFVRRLRPPAWGRVLPLALGLTFLAATAFLLLGGNPVPAGVAGVLAGICLLAARKEADGAPPSPRLLLIPIAIGLILRFYALAQVPNGYAEHAAILNEKLTFPYLQALSTSLSTLRLEPFLGVAWSALMHEQSGLLALITAVGFKVFGISLTVTRLISACLGLLTIFVAYAVGTELGGVRLGLVFAYLLAISPWHITISRYSTAEHVLSPLQFLLSLLYILRAVKAGRLRDIFMAAFFTSLAWYVYAPNLILLVIATIFLMYRAMAAPLSAVRNWRKAAVGLGCFLMLSYAPVANQFPQGILEPGLRTGYGSTGPILADWPKRLTMLGLEANQLIGHADDPWFATPGPALGTLQTSLLVPGFVLAAGALARERDRDLGVLVLLGFPLAFLPAVFAPDPSFRRLMLVATIAALASAFALTQIIDAARATRIPPRSLTAIVWVAALLLGAAGTFGYFDRTSFGEEVRNAWYRSLGAAVADNIAQEPIVVVVPGQNDVDEANRYIALMAHDALDDARQRGMAPEMLYVTATCQGVLAPEAKIPPADLRPLVIVPDTVLDPQVPSCGPAFAALLKQRYPSSPVMVTKPAPLPVDLQPAPP
jgi:hypothetical protein